jgi:hypothetical protein
MHCIIDMHHVKSLDALGRLLRRVHGAWSRHNGSIQLVWCTELLVLVYHRFESRSACLLYVIIRMFGQSSLDVHHAFAWAFAVLKIYGTSQVLM